MQLHPDPRPAGRPVTALSLRAALAVAAQALIAAGALAQGDPGAWSDEFDRPGLLGRAFAIGEHAGQLLAGGLSMQADGQQLGCVARFDGTHWQPLGAGIPGSEVRAFAEFQGELVVAGQFTAAGGVPARSIAAWDGSQWRALGAGLDLSFASTGRVFALAVYQGELYAGGQLDLADGQPVANVARWDGSQWLPVGAGIPGASSNAPVLAMVVGSDDRLYVGGEFTSAGGVTAHNVARWDGASWSAVGGGLPGPMNAAVRALEWHAEKLHAGGNFDVQGGQVHEKIAVFEGGTWVPLAVVPDTGIHSVVYALRSFGGNLFAGGNFTVIDGMSVHRLARYDGTQWSSIGGVDGSVLQTTVFDAGVHDGRLVVGGQFTMAGTGFAPGQPVVTHSIAAWDGAAWDGVGTGHGLDAAVRGAVHYAGGIVAVGSFLQAGGELSPFVSHFDGAAWSLLGVFDGTVNAAVIFGGDLVVNGSFGSVDGMPAPGVARYDGTAWHSMGSGAGDAALAVYQGQLYAGGLGGVKRWNGVSWESFAPQLFGQVYSMHVHLDVLYISGSLSGAGHIVSWDGATQQTVGGGTNGAVRSLGSHGGDLVAGGTFTQAGGTPAHRLARWDGSAWSAVPGLTGTNVDALAEFQGELVASGNLFLDQPPEKYIARWDGSTWSPFGGGLNGQAAVLLPGGSGGVLWAGGSFSKAEGRPAWHLSRWESTPPLVGTTYCFGDGTATLCPCGNAGAASSGCANATFAEGCALWATGSASLSAGTLVLRAARSAPLSTGVFFQGSEQMAGGNGVAFGDGLRCAGGTTVRLEAKVADGQGDVASSVDIGATSGAQPGDTRHHQWWYRDPQGLCGTGFNLSNGHSVTFSP